MKKLMALLMAAMMLFALAACSGEGEETQGNENDNEENNNEQTDTLTVGTSADYAPFEFHTMINGTDTIVGADIEMANAIAEDMGKELEIKDVSFDVLLNELQNGTIDMVIAGMSADPEREAQCDHSDVYYDAAYQRLIVREEDAEKFTSFDDFEGAKVAVQSGTIQVDLANENLTGCETVILQTVPDAFNNLINGKVDAVLVDGYVGDSYIETNEGLVAVEAEFPPQDGFVVWVQKGDPKGLLESINKTVAEIKGETYEGWVAEARELSGEE